MKINQSNAKFIVINGDPDSRAVLDIGDLCIENCESYVCLGIIFTQDASVELATKLHTQAKDKHICHEIRILHCKEQSLSILD